MVGYKSKEKKNDNERQGRASSLIKVKKVY